MLKNVEKFKRKKWNDGKEIEKKIWAIAFCVCMCLFIVADLLYGMVILSVHMRWLLICSISIAAIQRRVSV